MYHNKLKKKGQEEMVGLVLIMLVVAIIFLIFLGIFLRNTAKPQTSESKDIENFLEAVFEYTTSCGIDAKYPKKVNELILDCSNLGANTPCKNLDGQGCVQLKKVLKESIESNWNFNENSQTKGYKFQVLKETSSGEKDVLNNEVVGGAKSTNRIRAAEKILPGGIILRLEIFY